MIQSTSSSNGALRPDTLTANPTKVLSNCADMDQFSTDQTSSVRAALADQSEIRSEVVERGCALAADPNYPSAAIVRRVSEIIVSSPDLTDDEA